MLYHMRFTLHQKYLEITLSFRPSWRKAVLSLWHAKSQNFVWSTAFYSLGCPLPTLHIALAVIDSYRQAGEEGDLMACRYCSSPQMGGDGWQLCSWYTCLAVIDQAGDEGDFMEQPRWYLQLSRMGGDAWQLCSLGMSIAPPWPVKGVEFSSWAC